MATNAPIRVTDAPRIAASESAMEQIRDGLANAAAECNISEYMHVDSQDPAVFAWEETIDDVAQEVAPYVAALLDVAIAKRLPWEPQR